MECRQISAVAIGLSLVFSQSCKPESEPKTEGSVPAIASPAAKDAAPKKDVVEKSAIDALKRMSDFLMSAKTLQIDSQGSVDAVTDSDQRIQLDGTTTYRIKRPGFVIDYKSDIKNRRFIYDGKTFTIYSPTLKLYADTPAGKTNREVLDSLYVRHGIKLPLEDVFRWSDAMSSDRITAFQAAYKVGETTLDGVLTDHYAFREPGIDWQIWIEQGDRPFPRKIVIVDRDDPERPTFTANLKWKMNPAFAQSDFTFKPSASDRKIHLASYTIGGE